MVKDGAFISNSEYLVRNSVQAAVKSNKRLKAKHLFEFFLAWNDTKTQTYSRFVQSSLMIDLWMEECPILMIFSYFSCKWRLSPAQD